MRLIDITTSSKVNKMDMDTSHLALTAEVNSGLTAHTDGKEELWGRSDPESLCYLGTVNTNVEYFKRFIHTHICVIFLI